MTDGLNDNLIDGSELKGRADWSGLVTGNGFSQKLWRRFGYQAISQMGRAIWSPMVRTEPHSRSQQQYKPLQTPRVAG